MVENPRMPTRILRAAGWQTAERFAGAALLFAFMATAARTLGVGDFGRFSVGVAALILLEPLVDMGSLTAVLRLAAVQEGTAGTAARRAMCWRLGAVLAAVPVCWSIGILLPAPAPVWCGLAAALLAGHALAPAAVRLRLDLAWREIAGARVAGRAVCAAIGSALAAARISDPGPWLAVHALYPLISNALALVLARRRRPLGHGDLAPHALRSEAWAPGLAVLLVTAYFYLDQWLVVHLLGEEPAGLYAAAVRVFSLGAQIPALTFAAAFPLLARPGKTGAEEAGRHSRNTLGTLAGWFLPLAVLAVPCAPQGLALLFGEPYAQAGTAARWLALAVCIVPFGTAATTTCMARGIRGPLVGVLAAALVLNVAINLACLHRFGIEAAAIATCLTEAWVAVAARRLAVSHGVDPFPTVWVRRAAIRSMVALPLGLVTAWMLEAWL